MSILVLCPTRGRPEKTAEMVASFVTTAELDMTALLLVVDRDDPTLDAYYGLVAEGVGLMTVRGGSLTKATNEAVLEVWDSADIVGHVGDDHRFVTPGWDRMVDAALQRQGVAYGDDGYWHEEIPTAWFVTTDIVRRLRWLALPASDHYGIDNAWKDIGEALGALHYLPDMHITHPALEDQKASADPVYRRAQRHRRADAAAYYRWRDHGGLVRDLARLAGLGDVPDSQPATSAGRG